MNFRKNLPLISGCVVMGLLLVAGSVYMAKNYLVYHEANDVVENKKGELKRLNNRMPFPNRKNLQQEEKNKTLLEKQLNGLELMLEGQQLSLDKITDVDFARKLAQKKNVMEQWVAGSGVLLPEEGFDYGFPIYIAGEVPDPENLDRLCLQLNAIEKVVNLLCASGVNSIESIDRDHFEVLDDRTSSEVSSYGYGMGGSSNDVGNVSASYVDPDGLFSYERLQVAFQASESSLWNLMQKISNSPAFMIVRNIFTQTETEILQYDVESERESQEQMRRDPGRGSRGSGFRRSSNWTGRRNGEYSDQRGGSQGLAPMAPRFQIFSDPYYSLRSFRKIAGNELINVSILIDVYRFGSVESAAEESE